MSWSMPTSGQWPSGVTPENMGMGNYTPEQWTAMQQQHWQQWAQWQQQYATWQSQYGSKYAEQMQAIQSMGTMPPLPPANTAPPPAPPPPDKPPPPPHENNQPLYGHTQQQSKPVMAPGLNNDSSNNITDTQTGNNQNRSYATDVRADVALSSVNSEALKSLAEEEKAFDIQFQKWEEEIENWKKANINHPDRKAYEEYEQRFESCRARLLERRQQMKEKRAKLLGNVQQVSNNPSNSAPKHYTNINVPPPGHNATSSNFNINKEHPGNSYPPPPRNFNKSLMPIPQISNMPQKDYSRDYDTNFDPQDRYDSYMSTSNNTNVSNNSNLISTEPFLQTSERSKGIPGLDLVPEADKYVNKSTEVIDITDEPNKKPLISAQGVPDYSTISKGINNILGDEKIMNILSMVRGQGQKSDQGPSGVDAGNNSNKQWDRNEGPNNYGPGSNNYGPGPNNNYGPGSNNNYGSGQNNSYGPGQNNYGPGQNNFGPGQDNNCAPNKNNNYGPGQNNYGPGQNMPYNMQQKDYLMHQENNQTPNFASPPPRVFANKPDDMDPNQYYDRNQQNNGQNMPPRPMLSRPSGPRQMKPNMRPNMPMRSLLDPLPPQNEYLGGGYDRRDMLEGPPSQDLRPNVPTRPPPARPTWAEEPLFTPSIIVEYEHKPLRLKARDFIEPVHTFDYNHQSKDGDTKRKDFEKEADNLFIRNRKIPERDDSYTDRHKELFYRDHEKPFSRDHLRDVRDDHHLRGPPREDYNDRRRHDDNVRDRRYDDRRRDDRDKYNRRDDLQRDRDREDGFRDRDRDQERFRDRDAERFRDRERERDLDRLREKDRYPERGRERDRDSFKDSHRDHRRSKSHDKDNRKRGHSKESDRSTLSNSKKSRDGSIYPVEKPKHMVMIDDILEPPGRHIRPEKIVIILRGPPGSGKSYLAKLIREREAEHGGTVRVMSIDDYFMQEGEIEETDPSTGKIIKKPSLKYEYDEKQEENYIFSLKRAFKRSLTDGYFTFLIYDAVNDQLRCYADIWNFARQNNFQVYICTMDLDPQVCYKRNIHNRKLVDIELISTRFYPTPDHHIQLDPTTLLQNASIQEVQMEDVEDDVTMEDAQETDEIDKSFTSKWEKMDDAAQLARLDGTSKPLRPSQLSMEDYLQLDDWKPNTSKPGKKTVRWADIEERRQQEKMRAIGFVVGQTDWNRMTDPTMGSSALTQTKYIERVRRF